MWYLLSVGVVTFQLVIFLTIIGASRVGKGALNLVALGWTAFTLLGSIVTAGLLLLQLATIFIAYTIGNRRHRAPVTNSNAPPSGRGSAAGHWLVVAILVLAGIATGRFFGRQAAEQDLENVRQVRAAREVSQQPAAPPERVPEPRVQSAEERAKEEAAKEEARRRYLESIPEIAQ